ncbi:type VII secretion-associated serine protease [Planosporangium mesophilum]|uniref:Type VII secretion-associated serine protease n=2 Tax=Planosporangium mesophilum TaxID=689768 RepID=A0A8J3THX8_9ACTN|nr:type VII secretion-associated serine protease [Planosporangium mesophilum]
MVGGAAAVMLAAPPAVADSIRDRQWHLTYLNVAQAQAVNQGEGVTVAVVDSGVNGSHPDLAGNVLPGVDVSGAGVPNGQTDADGHGTGMASLIAAHGHGGGDGVLGIAPKAKIYPIRNGVTGKIDPEFMAAGIDAAVKSGAKVISISESGSDDLRVRAAVQAALATDAVVVAGIGNKPDDKNWTPGAPGGFLPEAPAIYDGVVAVGATDQNGNAATSIGITGNAMVLSAPGARIVSADKTGYAIGDGTSASTAIVAGTAALVRSKYPNLSAKEVVHRLTATATDKGAPGRDPQYGYGIVNPVAALTADVPPAAPSATPTTQAPAPAPATTGPTNAAGPDKVRPTRIITAAVIIGISAVVVLLAAGGVVAWLLLRRRGQPPAA